MTTGTPKTAPLFSIVIPTYNRAYILPNAIESILQQTFHDWHLTIVDDGSTDDTRDIMDHFLCDPRISYVYQENRGVSSARNRGLSGSIADWVTYVDSDDIVYPHYLETAHAYLYTNSEKTYALANAERFLELYDPQGALLASKREVLKETPVIEDFYNWSTKASIGTGFFHKKNLLARWNERLTLLENLDFIMQCGLQDPNGFLFIPEFLSIYRQRYGGDGTCSNATYQDWGDAFQRIYETHKDDPLMKNPDVYLSRIRKYQELQALYAQGKVAAPYLKFFPEHCPSHTLKK